MNRKRVVIVVVALLAIVGISAGWSTIRGQVPDQKNFDFTGPELTVITNDGDVEVVPVDRQQRQVSVTRWFKTNKLFGDAGLDWRMESDRTLRLTSRCHGMFVNCDLRYRLEVPSDTKLRVRAEDGTVRATGYAAELAIETRDGDIEIDDARGVLSLATDDGSVRATGLSSPRVTARSEDGDVELDFGTAPQTVVAHTDDGKIEVAAPDGPYKITTKVDDGSVDSTLKNDPAATRTIDATAGDGDIGLHVR
ncbi:DUF4097 family beta strand repeat-containing protein [Microlunatus speluncae]|uniref:DUF4097 family beta strand repeat-containing protein n=1 Tax=Microlunatus speluncae TaxID=2594267 RepID=UPI0012667E71|nr:DUF4097 family beta strand repeat-containing protein [Microlunatus speluncae]